jgi:hypothetical protein
MTGELRAKRRPSLLGGRPPRATQLRCRAGVEQGTRPGRPVSCRRWTGRSRRGPCSSASSSRPAGPWPGGARPPAGNRARQGLVEPPRSKLHAEGEGRRAGRGAGPCLRVRCPSVVEGERRDPTRRATAARGGWALPHRAGVSGLVCAAAHTIAGLQGAGGCANYRSLKLITGCGGMCGSSKPDCVKTGLRVNQV